MTFGRLSQQASVDEITKGQTAQKHGGGPPRHDGSLERGPRHVAMPVLTALAAAFILSGCQAGSFLEALMRTSMDDVEGLCAEYQVVAVDGQPITPTLLDQTRVIIERRANATGIAEPIVRVDGPDGVRVALPGIRAGTDDAELVLDLLSATGVLEFLPLPDDYFDSYLQDRPLPEGMLDTEPLFDGTEIESAAIGQDATTGEIVVNLQLGETGARLFDEHAAEHYGERFAIVLDGVVASAPSINATRFDGRAQIAGDFTIEEATNLVTVLKFGSLPLEIREVDSRVCGE